MTTKVQRWGNSQGLRLSRQILEDARIAVGDEVDVLVQDGTIMIAPVWRVRGRYRLRQLDVYGPVLQYACPEPVPVWLSLDRSMIRKGKNTVPASSQAWLAEIAAAYQDASEAIPFGPPVADGT